MPDVVPSWLNAMRALNGEKEVAGSGANPVITGMTDEIARRFPEMTEYCGQKAWDSDETPWCGVSAGYCVSLSGIRPPFQKGSDTDCFGWAQSWADDPNYIKQAKPVPGTIVVLQRSGGGHVTFFERWSGGKLMCRGGNQSNSVNEASFDEDNVLAYVWPKEGGDIPEPKPPDERRELSKGDEGEDVTALQKVLGVPADGDFGGVTESQVKGFQAACGIDADGVVGSNTWSHVDILSGRLLAADEGLTAEQIDDIVMLAEESPAMDYSWPDRGRTPPGYIPGMCLTFAVAVKWLLAGDLAAELMARPAGGPDTDALAWYATEFRELNMDNSKSGADTLRHLWTLLVGLGVRESSGKYCEGRDISASNTTADTAEAGLFQQSWNSRSASPVLPDLFNYFWSKPNGFLPTFSEGISPTSTNLAVYGKGSGATFQFLAKYCPLFACMSAAVALRTIRKHFGPINRKEADLVDEVEDLLFKVQEYMEQEPVPVPPDPIPEPGVGTVHITVESEGDVHVFVNGKEVLV